MTTKLQIEELLTAFERATGMGSVKAANKLLPEIVRSVIAYMEEVTAGPEASDLEFFRKRYSEALVSGDQKRIDVAKRQLDVLEDAVVIYGVQQSPERRQYFVDVGALPEEKVKEHLEAIKESSDQRSAAEYTAEGKVCPPCDITGDAANKIDFGDLVIKNPAPDASAVRAPTGRSKTINMGEPVQLGVSSRGAKKKSEAPAPKKPRSPPKR